MISILVACYNQDVISLATSLSQQAEALSVPAEIIIHENGDDEELHQKVGDVIKNLEKASYYVGQSEATRSASRNWMGNQSQYAHLLFLDGDAAVVDDQFLKRYVDLLPTKDVWVGGTAYRNTPPAPNKLLRWVYGREREQAHAEVALSNGHGSFSSFNFLLPRHAFEKVPFDETIKAYGHEDSLLGKELASHGIAIHRFNNPLFHEGLDDNRLFLEKSAEAVHTLSKLVQEQKLGEEIRLYAAYVQLKSFGLLSIYRGLFSLFQKRIESHLCGKNPKMRLFDLWKLGLFCRAMRAKKNPA